MRYLSSIALRVASRSKARFVRELKAKRGGSNALGCIGGVDRSVEGERRVDVHHTFRFLYCSLVGHRIELEAQSKRDESEEGRKRAQL
jgi:hypothetical protein